MATKQFFVCALVLFGGALRRGCADGSDRSSDFSFFVTSATSVTGNLGGLAGADATCQRLAAPSVMRTHVARLPQRRSAIRRTETSRHTRGTGSVAGPWYNANLVAVANSLADFHARTGDAALFLDERGQRINGQWTGFPTPFEHDILTGSNADGTLLAGLTCSDWTSDSAGVVGPGRTLRRHGTGPEHAPPLSSWNSAHANQNCANTAPRGGAGRFYRFAR